MVGSRVWRHMGNEYGSCRRKELTLHKQKPGDDQKVKVRGTLGSILTSINLHSEQPGAGRGGTADPLPESAWPRAPGLILALWPHNRTRGFRKAPRLLSGHLSSFINKSRTGRLMLLSGGTQGRRAVYRGPGCIPGTGPGGGLDMPQAVLPSPVT